MRIIIVIPLLSDYFSFHGKSYILLKDRYIKADSLRLIKINKKNKFLSEDILNPFNLIIKD